MNMDKINYDVLIPARNEESIIEKMDLFFLIIMIQ